MTSTVLGWILAILGGGSVLGGIGFIAVRGIKNWIKEKEDRDAFEKEIAEKEKQAQHWADRPRSDADVIDRLHKLAAKKR